MDKAVKALPGGFFRANQKKLFDTLEAHLGRTPHLVLLSGPVTTPHFDDDALQYHFPEKLFYYATGVSSDPDTYAVLSLAKRTVALFCREYDPTSNYWQKLKRPEDFKKEFEVDEAYFVKELPSYLKTRLSGDAKLFLYKGLNPYSGLPVLNPEAALANVLAEFKDYIDTSRLYEVATEARVTKTPLEIDALREAAEAGVYLHQQIMKQLRPGMTELELSNLFTSIRVARGGALAYPNIVAGAENASFLHYELTHNRELKSGELVLVDAGLQLNGYNSDITRTLPVSGKFSAKQTEVYNAVFEAQKAALAKVKAGTKWLDVHITAEKSLLGSLAKLGLVKGEVEELWTNRVIFFFMPHGIGHYIGLYTHDLKGLKVKEDEYPPLKRMNLRVTRTLEEGMVLTVEPGLYFNQSLLEAAYADTSVSGYFNKEAIEGYAKEVGGIRLEDMVAVRTTDYALLTEGLPRSAEEIEAYMKK